MYTWFSRLLWIVEALLHPPIRGRTIVLPSFPTISVDSPKMAQGSCFCENIKYEYEGVPAHKVSEDTTLLRWALHLQLCYNIANWLPPHRLSATVQPAGKLLAVHIQWTSWCRKTSSLLSPGHLRVSANCTSPVRISLSISAEIVEAWLLRKWEVQGLLD